MSEYTVGLALGSILVILFDIYAYYRYRYSVDVLNNAMRMRKLAEAARTFEDERVQRSSEAYMPKDVSFEFQRVNEMSGFSQLETIPVSFDELKRTSGVSSAEQEKEIIKLKDELTLLNEQLASLKKQALEPTKEESLEAEQSDIKTNVSFAEKSERAEEREGQAEEAEVFEAELNEREQTPNLESATSIGEREHAVGNVGESFSSGLAQDLTAEEEPEEEEFAEPRPKRIVKTSKADKVVKKSAKKTARKKR